MKLSYPGKKVFYSICPCRRILTKIVDGRLKNWLSVELERRVVRKSVTTTRNGDPGSM